MGLAIKLLWMRKRDRKTLALYPERFKSLDKELQKINYEMEGAPSWAIREWRKALEELPSVTTIYDVDEATSCALAISVVVLGLMGIIIFGIALYNIIGWSIAPNASAFMWIVDQIRCVQ